MIIMLKNTEKSLDKLVALSKTRGFVFPGSEIYGGLANTWDYGPESSLKKILKRPGERNSFRKTNTMSGSTALFL